MNAEESHLRDYALETRHILFSGLFLTHRVTLCNKTPHPQPFIDWISSMQLCSLPLPAADDTDGAGNISEEKGNWFDLICRQDNIVTLLVLLENRRSQFVVCSVATVMSNGFQVLAMSHGMLICEKASLFKCCSLLDMLSANIDPVSLASLFFH